MPPPQGEERWVRTHLFTPLGGYSAAYTDSCPNLFQTENQVPPTKGGDVKRLSPHRSLAQASTTPGLPHPFPRSAGTNCPGVLPGIR